MSVVMSPKGLKAPPALAATTMMMQDTATKRGCPTPTASTTAAMMSAVVRLSATAEMKKPSRPVSQKIPRSDKARDAEQHKTETHHHPKETRNNQHQL